MRDQPGLGIAAPTVSRRRAHTRPRGNRPRPVLFRVATFRNPFIPNTPPRLQQLQSYFDRFAATIDGHRVVSTPRSPAAHESAGPDHAEASRPPFKETSFRDAGISMSHLPSAHLLGLDRSWWNKSRRLTSHPCAELHRPDQTVGAARRLPSFKDLASHYSSSPTRSHDSASVGGLQTRTRGWLIEVADPSRATARAARPWPQTPGRGKPHVTAGWPPFARVGRPRNPPCGSAYSR